jgi:hypothetical protein
MHNSTHFLARSFCAAFVLGGVFASPVAAQDVSLAATALPAPIAAIPDGPSGFEAVSAVARGPGCTAPHIVIRATAQNSWWDVWLGSTPTAKARTLALGAHGVNVHVRGDDNTGVSLPGGAAMFQLSGWGWAPLSPKPAWWEQDYPGDTASDQYRSATPGQRGFHTFWTVNGCTTTASDEVPDWTFTGAIDAALVGARNFNNVVQSADYCALNPERIAGWDRPEFYADIFTPKRLYVSVDCSRISALGGKKTSSGEIYKSVDNGKHWSAVAGLTGGRFYSMATTPSGGGRLWLLGLTSLYWLDGATLNGPLDVSTASGKPIAAADIANTTRVNSGNDNNKPPHVLAHVGNDQLVAAYPVIDGAGGFAYVFALITGTNTSAPKATALAGLSGSILKASHAGGSIVDLAMVADPRINGAGAVVAYWIESEAATGPNSIGAYSVVMHARYAVVSPYGSGAGTGFELTSDLSTWSGTFMPSSSGNGEGSANFWYGDYFHGAGFKDGRLGVANYALI